MIEHEAKERVNSSILAAQDELDKALDELQRLPRLDVDNVRYAAHALNNYLTVTLGCAGLLEHELADASEQVRTWVEGIRETSLRMKAVVEQLNSFARADEMQLRWEAIDLTRVVSRACEFYHAAAAKKAITLHCDLAENVTVWSDRVAICVVLDNLLSNALKYSPRGTNVHVTVRTDGDEGICAVRDEGPGLTSEQQQRLFQPGVPLGHLPTGGETSSGYGLAIARDTLERLGGAISCDSEPGHGATFTFRLPRREA